MSGSAPGSEWSRLTVGMAAVATVTTVIALFAWFRPDASLPVMRLRTVLWDETPVSRWPLRSRTALAPDGSSIVYSDSVGNSIQLVLKRRDEVVRSPLAGTEGGIGPFFSPDGAWIGFFAEGTLRKVPSGGGAVITLTDSANFSWSGGAWLDDGMIVFVGVPRDLRRVSEAGGSAEVLVSRADVGGRFLSLPWPLPGARGVLFSACSANCATSDVYVYDARADTVRMLFQGALGIWYTPTGHVVYAGLGGGLFAAPFNLGTLEVTGPAIPVVDDLQPPELTFSQEGTALYVVGDTSASAAHELVWVDRSGRATPVDPGWTFQAGNLDFGMSLSPDNMRLALRVLTDLGYDIWIKHLPDGNLQVLEVRENEPSQAGEFFRARSTCLGPFIKPVEVFLIELLWIDFSLHPLRSLSVAVCPNGCLLFWNADVSEEVIVFVVVGSSQ